MDGRGLFWVGEFRFCGLAIPRRKIQDLGHHNQNFAIHEMAHQIAGIDS